MKTPLLKYKWLSAEVWTSNSCRQKQISPWPLLRHGHKNIHFMLIPAFSPSPPGTQWSAPAWIVHDDVSVTFWKSAEKNSEQKAEDEFCTLYWAAGLLSIKLSHCGLTHTICVSFFLSESAAEISFVPVNGVSPSNVFHLDFTPEKKTTKIISVCVDCFPPITVPVFRKVLCRTTESKSVILGRTK